MLQFNAKKVSKVKTLAPDASYSVEVSEGSLIWNMDVVYDEAKADII